LSDIVRYATSLFMQFYVSKSKKQQGSWMIMHKILGAALAFGAFLTLGTPASASLIHGADLAIPGGVGNSNVVLSLQSPGSSITESGSVTPAGCTGDTIGPCPGVANSLRSFSSAGITSASALTLFLDAAEPGSDSLITLTGLTLNVYNAANSLVFTAPFGGTLPLNLIPSPGQGNNPVNTFVLDTTEAAALQAIFSSTLQVGLSASFTNAQGGPDRFFLGSRTVTPAPEPASIALLGAGLAGIGLLRRKRS
jgi:hypothetical protein